MSFRINSGANPYNSLFRNKQGMNRKKKPSSNIDFTSMGRVRDAVYRQKSSEQISSKLGKSSTGEPLYDRKVTWYGIDITDNPHAHKEIVPISDSVKKEIFENVKKDFEATGRQSKDDVSIMESFFDLADDYVKNIEGMDKLKSSWSMSQYRREVHGEIEAKVRELDPKWDWGQPVKTEVLGKIFGSKIDISI